MSQPFESEFPRPRILVTAMQAAKLNNLVLYVLVLCALVTTGLVVRRELMSPPPTAQAIPSKPTFRKDWQDALQHGIRIGPAHAPVQLVEFADFQCLTALSSRSG